MGENMKATGSIDSDEYRKRIVDCVPNLTKFGLYDNGSLIPKVSTGLTYSIDEASTYLSSQLDNDISPQNLIELSSDSETIGCYLQSKKYHLMVTSSSIPTFENIEESIRNGLIDISYKLNFDGLVRLKKTHRLRVFPNLQRQTLAQLRDGGVIELNQNLSILPLQPSLSDYILGVSWCIRIKNLNEKIEITKNDLRFRKKELDDYLMCQRAENSSQSESKAIDQENIRGMIVRPIFGSVNRESDEKLIFVLMPFDEKRNSIYQACIKPTIESQFPEYVCKRADDIRGIGPIMKDIWESICKARLIIADLSDSNANVLYEVGIAHTVGKDTILLKEKSNDFPFDVGHLRIIQYVNDIRGAENLKYTLLETLNTQLV